jgi:GT2 family glycosyltransferase
MRTADVTVVVVTRDRCRRLLTTLERLTALPDAPPIIVVDNASGDDSVDAVRRRHPEVELITLPENRGSAGRTAGVQAARTPYVAFADDDSWWAPGALVRAAQHLAGHRRLGLLAGRVLVGPNQRPDPMAAEMAGSPVTCPRHLPGPPVLGFIACGAVVRRCAYLQVGGFNEVLFFLGEERVLAVDLAAAGWDLAYAPDVVAHHHPAQQGENPSRRALALRNDLLTDWMRRPLPVALRSSWSLAWQAGRDRAARAALAGAVRRAPAALAQRQRLPAHVEHQLRRLRP